MSSHHPGALPNSALSAFADLKVATKATKRALTWPRRAAQRRRLDAEHLAQAQLHGHGHAGPSMAYALPALPLFGHEVGHERQGRPGGRPIFVLPPIPSPAWRHKEAQKEAEAALDRSQKGFKRHKGFTVLQCLTVLQLKGLATLSILLRHDPLREEARALAQELVARAPRQSARLLDGSSWLSSTSLRPLKPFKILDT